MIEVKPRAGRILHFQIGAIAVSLRCDPEKAREDFVAMYRPCLRRQMTSGRVIHMEVRSRGRSLLGRRYDILGDGRPISTHRHVDEIVPHLEWAINRRVIATRSEFLQLHAATLMRDGFGVVLAGASGAGKSTLAAALLGRGWRYLSDEFALIHHETAALHPFPRALCVKEGAFHLMKELGLPVFRKRPYVRMCKGQLAYVRPHDVSATAVGERCPIRLVAFPRYTGHRTPRVHDVPRAKAAFRLACHMMNRPVYGHRAAPVLTRAVRDAVCIGVETGEVRATCDLIEQAFETTCSGSAGVTPALAVK